jgi:hypothetical protein
MNKDSHRSLFTTKLLYTYQMHGHPVIYLVVKGNSRQIFPVKDIQERIKITRWLSEWKKRSQSLHILKNRNQKMNVLGLP